MGNKVSKKIITVLEDSCKSELAEFFGDSASERFELSTVDGITNSLINRFKPQVPKRLMKYVMPLLFDDFNDSAEQNVYIALLTNTQLKQSSTSYSNYFEFAIQTKQAYLSFLILLWSHRRKNKEKKAKDEDLMQVTIIGSLRQESAAISNSPENSLLLELFGIVIENLENAVSEGSYKKATQSGVKMLASAIDHYISSSAQQFNNGGLLKVAVHRQISKFTELLIKIFFLETDSDRKDALIKSILKLNHDRQDLIGHLSLLAAILENEELADFKLEDAEKNYPQTAQPFYLQHLCDYTIHFDQKLKDEPIASCPVQELKISATGCLCIILHKQKGFIGQIDRERKVLTITTEIISGYTSDHQNAQISSLVGVKFVKDQLYLVMRYQTFGQYPPNKMGFVFPASVDFVKGIYKISDRDVEFPCARFTSLVDASSHLIADSVRTQDFWKKLGLQNVESNNWRLKQCVPIDVKGQTLLINFIENNEQCFMSYVKFLPGQMFGSDHGTLRYDERIILTKESKVTGKWYQSEGGENLIEVVVIAEYIFSYDQTGRYLVFSHTTGTVITQGRRSEVIQGFDYLSNSFILMKDSISKIVMYMRIGEIFASWSLSYNPLNSSQAEEQMTTSRVLHSLGFAPSRKSFSLDFDSKKLITLNKYGSVLASALQQALYKDELKIDQQTIQSAILRKTTFNLDHQTFVILNSILLTTCKKAISRTNTTSTCHQIYKLALKLLVTHLQLLNGMLEKSQSVKENTMFDLLTKDLMVSFLNTVTSGYSDDGTAGEIMKCESLLLQTALLKDWTYDVKQAFGLLSVDHTTQVSALTKINERIQKYGQHFIANSDGEADSTFIEEFLNLGQRLEQIRTLKHSETMDSVPDFRILVASIFSKSIRAFCEIELQGFASLLLKAHFYGLAEDSVIYKQRRHIIRTIRKFVSLIASEESEETIKASLLDGLESVFAACRPGLDEISNMLLPTVGEIPPVVELAICSSAFYSLFTEVSNYSMAQSVADDHGAKILNNFRWCGRIIAGMVCKFPFTRSKDESSLVGQKPTIFSIKYKGNRSKPKIRIIKLNPFKMYFFELVADQTLPEDTTVMLMKHFYWPSPISGETEYIQKYMPYTVLKRSSDGPNISSVRGAWSIGVVISGSNACEVKINMSCRDNHPSSPFTVFLQPILEGVPNAPETNLPHGFLKMVPFIPAGEVTAQVLTATQAENWKTIVEEFKPISPVLKNAYDDEQKFINQTLGLYLIKLLKMEACLDSPTSEDSKSRLFALLTHISESALARKKQNISSDIILKTFDILKSLDLQSQGLKQDEVVKSILSVITDPAQEESLQADYGSYREYLSNLKTAFDILNPMLAVPIIMAEAVAFSRKIMSIECEHPAFVSLRETVVEKLLKKDRWKPLTGCNNPLRTNFELKAAANAICDPKLRNYKKLEREDIVTFFELVTLILNAPAHLTLADDQVKSIREMLMEISSQPNAFVYTSITILDDNVGKVAQHLTITNKQEQADMLSIEVEQSLYSETGEVRSNYLSDKDEEDGSYNTGDNHDEDEEEGAEENWQNSDNNKGMVKEQSEEDSEEEEGDEDEDEESDEVVKFEDDDEEESSESRSRQKKQRANTKLQNTPGLLLTDVGNNNVMPNEKTPPYAPGSPTLPNQPTNSLFPPQLVPLPEFKTRTPWPNESSDVEKVKPDQTVISDKANLDYDSLKLELLPPTGLPLAPTLAKLALCHPKLNQVPPKYEIQEAGLTLAESPIKEESQKEFFYQIGNNLKPPLLKLPDHCPQLVSLALQQNILNFSSQHDSKNDPTYLFNVLDMTAVVDTFAEEVVLKHDDALMPARKWRWSLLGLDYSGDLSSTPGQIWAIGRLIVGLESRDFSSLQLLLDRVMPLYSKLSENRLFSLLTELSARLLENINKFIEIYSKPPVKIHGEKALQNSKFAQLRERLSPGTREKVIMNKEPVTSNYGFDEVSENMNYKAPALDLGLLCPAVIPELLCRLIEEAVVRLPEHKEISFEILEGLFKRDIIKKTFRQETKGDFMITEAVVKLRLYPREKFTALCKKLTETSLSLINKGTGSEMIVWKLAGLSYCIYHLSKLDNPVEVDADFLLFFFDMVYKLFHEPLEHCPFKKILLIDGFINFNTMTKKINSKHFEGLFLQKINELNVLGSVLSQVEYGSFAGGIASTNSYLDGMFLQLFDTGLFPREKVAEFADSHSRIAVGKIVANMQQFSMMKTADLDPDAIIRGILLRDENIPMKNNIALQPYIPQRMSLEGLSEWALRVDPNLASVFEIRDGDRPLYYALFEDNTVRLNQFGISVLDELPKKFCEEDAPLNDHNVTHKEVIIMQPQVHRNCFALVDAEGYFRFDDNIQVYLSQNFDPASTGETKYISSTINTGILCGYVDAEGNLLDHVPKTVACIDEDKVIYYEDVNNSLSFYAVADNYMKLQVKQYSKNDRVFNLEVNPLTLKPLRIVHVSKNFYLILYPGGIITSLNFDQEPFNTPKSFKTLEKTFHSTRRGIEMSTATCLEELKKMKPNGGAQTGYKQVLEELMSDLRTNSPQMIVINTNARSSLIDIASGGGSIVLIFDLGESYEFRIFTESGSEKRDLKLIITKTIKKKPIKDVRNYREGDIGVLIVHFEDLTALVLDLRNSALEKGKFFTVIEDYKIHSIGVANRKQIMMVASPKTDPTEKIEFYIIKVKKLRSAEPKFTRYVISDGLIATKDTRIHDSSCFLISSAEWNLKGVFHQRFNGIMPYPISIRYDPKTQDLNLKSFAGDPDFMTKFKHDLKDLEDKDVLSLLLTRPCSQFSIEGISEEVENLADPVKMFLQMYSASTGIYKDKEGNEVKNVLIKNWSLDFVDLESEINDEKFPPVIVAIKGHARPELEKLLKMATFKFEDPEVVKLTLMPNLAETSGPDWEKYKKLSESIWKPILESLPHKDWVLIRDSIVELTWPADLDANTYINKVYNGSHAVVEMEETVQNVKALVPALDARPSITPEHIYAVHNALAVMDYMISCYSVGHRFIADLPVFFDLDQYLPNMYGLSINEDRFVADYTDPVDNFDLQVDRYRAEGATKQNQNLSFLNQLFYQVMDKLYWNIVLLSKMQGLELHFVGEDGYDAGGLLKEYFTQIAREAIETLKLFIPSPNFGEAVEENDKWIPNPRLTSDIDMMNYFKFGFCLGLTFKMFITMSMDFPKGFWKWKDYESIDHRMYKLLESLLNMDAKAIEDLDLKFVREASHPDDRPVELVRNGSNIPVTKENVVEYYSRMRCQLIDQIATPYLEMKAGFKSIISSSILQQMTPNILEESICGSKKSITKLIDDEGTEENNISEVYALRITMFWDVMSTLNQAQLSKYLQFVTGSSRLNKSHSEHTINFSNTKNLIPLAHTCSNTIDIGLYDSGTELRNKLLFAIEHHKGFMEEGFSSGKRIHEDYDLGEAMNKSS